MSQLGDVATSVVGMLSALQVGAGEAFATVGVCQLGDRKAAAASLARQRQPAAYVLYDGLERRAAGGAVPGAALLAVIVAAENLRGGSAALTGEPESVGVLDLLEDVSAVLDGAVIPPDHRLVLRDERQLASDERAVVFEQRYLAERLAELGSPTFDGVAIAGSASMVTVQLHSLESAAIEFGFPGIDGVYRHHLGMRSRRISWTGCLVADDDAGLNALEAELERLVVAGVAAEVVDAWGRTFSECVLDRFERQGRRRRHSATGAAVQQFELTFSQLSI
ncbi:MAG: DUF1834 family protein [bacterium]|nr:DUF1834 family protein [bacterium]